MLKVLLSTVSICLLVVSTLPLPVFARSCPRNPTTLLSLYRNSDLIYVGTFDKTEYGEPTTETGGDYKVIPVKKYFTISSTLKGEPRKFVELDDLEYQFKYPELVTSSETDVDDTDESASEAKEVETESDGPEEAAEGEEVEVLINGAPFRPVKPGDSVLLFLDRVTEDDEDTERDSDDATERPGTAPASSDRLELSDEPYGLKNLTADSLAAYEARIKELNGIFGSKEPSYSEIVAWLVRCAEDPLTRWEGTFELAASFRALEWEKERMKESEETRDEEHAETSHPTEKFFSGDVGFAKALSDTHKKVLTNVLLNRGNVSRPAPVRDIRGDTELIDLVGRWGDSTVAAGLFEKLKDQSGSDLTADLMTTISSILDNDELSSIWDRYSKIQWQDGAAFVEEKVGTEVPAGDPQPIEAPAIEPVAPVAEELANANNIAAEDEERATDVDEAEAVNPQPKKRTYAEARRELLEQFKSLATKLLSKESDKRTAKLNP